MTRIYKFVNALNDQIDHKRKYKWSKFNKLLVKKHINHNHATASQE